MIDIKVLFTILLFLPRDVIPNSEEYHEQPKTRLLASQDELLAQIQGEIKAIKDCLSKRGIAFTAQLSSHKPVLGDHQTIDFDQVITNVGDAWDPNTSIFTAPTDGVYAFEVVVGTNGVNATDLEIVKNGAHLKRVYGMTYHHWGTSTASVTAHLVTGDRVYVKQYTYNGGLVGHELTSFSGYLINPDCHFN